VNSSVLTENRPTVRLFRLQGPEGAYLGVEIEAQLYEFPGCVSDEPLADWLSLADPVSWLLEKLEKPLVRIEHGIVRLAPIDLQEVWASGVTYLRSKAARIEESEQGGDFYAQVYTAERPELFFKSMPARVVGNGQPIRIRRDSDWNVPEPELVLVLSSSGRVVGYTIGNDVSSRSIEGENPLYLPQAKVYDGSCAIGPAILVKTENGCHREIEMTIERGGNIVFAGEVSTEKMQRTETELAEFLFRELSFRHGVFLLTGTGMVPPDDFTLRPRDIVRITIEGIGTLENPVA
jgi:2-dehydro-3-deoxy-D-arabinonate dehydratase